MGKLYSTQEKGMVNSRNSPVRAQGSQDIAAGQGAHLIWREGCTKVLYQE